MRSDFPMYLHFSPADGSNVLKLQAPITSDQFCGNTEKHLTVKTVCSHRQELIVFIVLNID